MNQFGANCRTERVFPMICNERSTRILPGLNQALSWLRESLPPAARAPLVPVPIAVPARPPRHRPTTAGNGTHRLHSRYRHD
jgi:hypothetical protein